MTIAALLFVWLLSVPTPLQVIADPIPVVVPSPPSSILSVVQQNFLGISFELSFLDDYFGDGASIPKPILNYLRTMRSRTGPSPVRIRIGGNSLDTSTYVPTQGVPMIRRDTALNVDNQPAHYGPVVWDVLSKVASSIGGATFIIGLPLIKATDPFVAIAAGHAYSRFDDLDAFLLGNEPDLYATHGFRPRANWTEAAYINDYRTSSSQLTVTSAGDILQRRILAGPAVCCNWTLSTLIQDGYIPNIGNYLKYIALQHYPNNNCNGFKGTASYYTQHPNVVQLGTWQKTGINTSISRNQTVIMSEFNSIACGGVHGISNTFAVGSLWTVDYALQLASVGYSAAHIHTRERGISYNLFTSSDGPATSSSRWTTNPTFYGVLVTAEALRSNNGAIVVDLNLEGTSKTAHYGGYAVYDAHDKTLQQLVFFNYANVSASDKQNITFRLPEVTFPPSKRQNLDVKFLTGESMRETTNISWGGLTYANVVDGNLINSTAAWAPATIHVNCEKGCNIDVPGPGLAVVFGGGQTNSSITPTSTFPLNSSSRTSFSSPISVVLAILAIWTYLL